MPIRVKVTDEHYNYVDRALVDAGLSIEADIRVREMLEERGLPAALGLLAGEKTAERLKAAAAADEFDALGQDFARILRTRAMAPGGDKASEVRSARAYLAQLSGQRNGGDGTLGDEEKARVTKAAQPRDFLAGVAEAMQEQNSIVEAQRRALGVDRDHRWWK